jgi:hypothetical protein
MAASQAFDSDVPAVIVVVSRVGCSTRLIGHPQAGVMNKKFFIAWIKHYRLVSRKLRRSRVPLRYARLTNLFRRRRKRSTTR